ncbi:hypothetical protein ABPG74_000874 [Tetrahymena malaccensis]
MTPLKQKQYFGNKRISIQKCILSTEIQITSLISHFLKFSYKNQHLNQIFFCQILLLINKFFFILTNKLDKRFASNYFLKELTELLTEQKHSHRILRQVFALKIIDKNFANARFSQNIFEYQIQKPLLQANNDAQKWKQYLLKQYQRFLQKIGICYNNIEKTQSAFYAKVKTAMNLPAVEDDGEEGGDDE